LGCGCCHQRVIARTPLRRDTARTLAMSNQGARGSADFHTTHHHTSLHLNRGIERGCVGFIRTHACLGCSIEMSSCSSIPVLFSLQASCWLLPRCSSVVQQQNLTGIRFTKASSAPSRRRRPPIQTPASTFLWIETRVHVAHTRALRSLLTHPLSTPLTLRLQAASCKTCHLNMLLCRGQTTSPFPAPSRRVRLHRCDYTHPLHAMDF
jgi:hypothetical protein